MIGVVRFEGSDWREALAYRVGEGDTYWWTSNADYAADGTEPRAFGQAWVCGLGAVSAHGCLFSETDYVHADTMVTRSYDLDEASGEWTPRRTYTWVRRAGDPRELCPGLARADA